MLSVFVRVSVIDRFRVSVRVNVTLRVTVRVSARVRVQVRVRVMFTFRVSVKFRVSIGSSLGFQLEVIEYSIRSNAIAASLKCRQLYIQNLCQGQSNFQLT